MKCEVKATGEKMDHSTFASVFTLNADSEKQAVSTIKENYDFEDAHIVNFEVNVIEDTDENCQESIERLIAYSECPAPCIR